MTKSFRHHDADSSERDFGVPERTSNVPLTKEEREDYYERLMECEVDSLIF